MAEPNELERDLQQIAMYLRKLEGEYNMFFAGRVPRPPWETRSRLDALLKKWERAYIDNLTQKFRLNTLQSRYATFTDLWDRGMRAREEGRPGPFHRGPAAGGGPPPPAASRQQDPGDRVVHVTSFSSAEEGDRIRHLYESLSSARRETGEDPVPFSRFADLVREQVRTLRQAGTAEVAFRVSVKNGKVSLTARGVKETKE